MAKLSLLSTTAAIGIPAMALALGGAGTAQANPLPNLTNLDFENYTGATPKNCFTCVAPTGWTGGGGLIYIDSSPGKDGKSGSGGIATRANDPVRAFRETMWRRTCKSQFRDWVSTIKSRDWLPARHTQLGYPKKGPVRKRGSPARRAISGLSRWARLVPRFTPRQAATRPSRTPVPLFGCVYEVPDSSASVTQQT